MLSGLVFQGTPDNTLIPSNRRALYAALENGYCQLTPSGKFFWELAKKQRI